MTEAPARPELPEATGLRAVELQHRGQLDLAPGLSMQEFDVWLATGLTIGAPASKATETDMRHDLVAETDLRAMIRHGRFTDGPSLAAYSLLLLDRK